MTVVNDAAAASERRQKAGAILMSLSLLDSGARGLRVEAENQSDRKLGQISGRALEIESAIYSIDRGFCETLWISRLLMASLNWFRSGESAKIFSRIELTRRKAFGGPRLRQMATLPLQNSYRCDQCGTPEIVAVPVLFNREPVRSPACSITAQANRIPHKQQRHPVRGVTSGHSWVGDSS